MYQGIDASSYDTCPTTNWSQAYHAGIRWCSLRAVTTDRFHRPIIDPKYLANVPLVLAAGIKIWSYAWLDPLGDAKLQADLFIQVCDLRSSRTMLDLEDSGSIVANPLTTPAKIRTWLRMVRFAILRPVIYTIPNYIKLYLSKCPDLVNYPLFIANWGVAAPLVPMPFVPDPLAWQYTNNGDGGYYGFDQPGFSIKQVALSLAKEV